MMVSRPTVGFPPKPSLAGWLGRLTLGVYMDVDLPDCSTAIASLPALPGGNHQVEPIVEGNSVTGATIPSPQTMPSCEVTLPVFLPFWLRPS
jgi:hypothetical protein